MIKARNKKLSMLLVLAMLMTMFVGVGTASAAAITYSAVGTPILDKGINNQDIQLLISIEDAIVFSSTYPSIVTIQLPSNVELAGDPTVTVTAKQSPPPNLASAGNVTAKAKSSRVVDLTVQPGSYEDEAKILLNFRGLNVKSGSGDIVATLLAPSGSKFPSGSVTIGKIAKGKAMVVGGSVKNIGDGVEKIDTITVAETAPGVFTAGDEIKFELSKGFEWVDQGAVVGGWAFDGRDDGTFSGVPVPGYTKAFTTNINDRVLTVTLDPSFAQGSSAGRISLGTDLGIPALGKNPGDLLPRIQATDEAKEGDVTVTVSGDNIEKTKIVVAKYGTYEVKVVEGTTEEVLAGRDNEEIGEFYIEEAVAGSLIPNRTVILELPDGVKWAKDSNNDPIITVDVEEGDNVFSGQSFGWVAGTKERAIKITVGPTPSDDASKILFKDAEVKVDPDFKGDVVVTVRGTAGAEGKVKVAEAKLPVTISAQNTTKIVVGAPNQKVGDIIIKESTDEAIIAGASRNIVIGLDAGYRFSSKPVVKVTEGDLEIDSVKLIEEDTQLKFNIKYSSNEPSTITISDVYVTAYRTVPEGPVKATLIKMEGYDASNIADPFHQATGSTALVDWDTDKSAGNTVIAECVTPAAGAGVAEFRIGSNIYYVNGVAKVMDVAPYIKDSRTYVPMRYVAEMLGAEVVWDDAARTVTLTRGDDVVVFTIGSTTYTVNGEAKTADVAPEIANSRTMLPARYVAEAFGAVVGWDAATQTVLVQQ